MLLEDQECQLVLVDYQTRLMPAMFEGALVLSNAVRLALERAREAAGQPPPVALVLPEHVARRDAPVRPHALGSYDRPSDDPPDPPPDPAGDAQ